MDPTAVVNFYQNDYPCVSFVAFEEMRKRKQLCDIIIKVQNHSFAVHRVIIAGGIPYFQSVLVSSTENSCKEIVLGDLDPGAVETLISFAYSGKVDISTKNVHCLLLASHFLQVHQVSDACIEFISNRLNLSTVVHERAFAHNIGIASLVEKSSKYLQQNFAEFSKSDYFLSLPHVCVKEVICSDDLNVSSEEEVFQAVMRWVKASPSERHSKLLELLSEVRMVNLPVNYLVNEVASEELIQTSKPCMDLLDKIKNYHLVRGVESHGLKSQLRKASVVSSGSVQECDTVQQGLYTVYNYKKFGIICYIDVSKKIRREVSVNQQNDPISCVVAVKDKIYMFLKRTIQIFHTREEKWDVIESDHMNILAAAVVLHENIIYIFIQSENSASCIDCFDTKTHKWKGALYSKKRTSRDLAACSLGKSVYAVGGYSVDFLMIGVKRLSAHGIVEKYCPSTLEWSDVSSLLTERAGHSCITMNEKIYVCGGYRWDMKDKTNVKSVITSAEVYDPLVGQWNFISSMNTGRYYFSLVASNGKLFALGGYGEEGTDTLSDVEVFDSETKMWTYDFSVGMVLTPGFKGAVVVPTNKY